MKKLIKTISILLLVGVMFGCSEDDLEQLNVDKKNPAEVPGEPLFTNGARNMFDMLLGTNVNKTVFRLYAQYWAQTTYPEESQFTQVTRNIPDNMWDDLYKDVLQDLKGAREIIEAEDAVTDSEVAIKNNKLAVIKIVEVYAYSTLVDLFGDVPYTQALNPDEYALPAYDDAATVYDAIISLLDGAINDISQSEIGFAGADPIYQGNMSKWYKAANSLKLRMALRLADANPSKAKSMAEAAANKVFDSNADNMAIEYTSSSPNTHPLWSARYAVRFGGLIRSLWK